MPNNDNINIIDQKRQPPNYACSIVFNTVVRVPRQLPFALPFRAFCIDEEH